MFESGQLPLAPEARMISSACKISAHRTKAEDFLDAIAASILGIDLLSPTAKNEESPTIKSISNALKTSLFLVFIL